MESVDTLFFNHADATYEITDFDLKSVLAAVESSLRITSQCGFVIDFDDHKVLFRTDQLFYADEATHYDFKRGCANPYWSLVSEDTLKSLLQIRSSYPPISEVLSIEEYSKHTCTIDYPISIRGHELFIMQKFTPLLLRPDGITRIGLFTINPSNKKDVECLIIAPRGRRFRFDFSKGQFNEFNLGKVLTTTEKAILFRVKMGMTNEDIAKNMYLSTHTVKTHRARIFKKLNVDSISEALTVLGNYQLL